MSKRRRWSYTAGKRPHSVTVFEREPGGPIYGRAWDPTRKSWKRRSLGHKDRAQARAWALAQAAKLSSGAKVMAEGRATVAHILEAYARHRTPRKTPHEQQADRRRSAMWLRHLGAAKDPHTVSLKQWETFIEGRRSGLISPRGESRSAAEARTVGMRSVEADCKWLRWVFNWASRWRLQSGEYLMRENPVRGFPIPTEKNPRRPVATQDRFEAVRAVSDDVLMQTRWGGVVDRRSYLSELLELANGTGRRLSAICRLTYADLRLDSGSYDAIRWPAATDKGGRESLVPISGRVRKALDRVLRERPGIGAAPLFPSPEDPQRPISRHLADRWLRKAEALAGLEPQRGSLWHAYRRKWATERKHLPDVDVAAAGGWKTLQTLKSAYQQADQQTMLRVVTEAGELREAR